MIDAFVQKITGSKDVDRPLQRIRELRNRPNPGIAVTVDLLTTGVDIPDLEFIVFLRPVKSRILFEQMLGRGTRKGEHSQWTDATWNPVRGCTKVSPGCKHCYAQTFAERFRGVPGHPYERGFDLRLAPDKLAEPVRWRRPRMVFVNSMSDLFHEAVPDEYIVSVARVMELSKWHVFQVLTKRAERMAHLLETKLRSAADESHIWWGVSVEDRKHGLPRLDLLRSTTARVRFLSVEPLLEDLGALKLKGIDWVIVGGESGPGARTMEERWVTSIQQECKTERVPFFFKQWGGFQKKKAGRLLAGRTFDEMPPRPKAVVPSALAYESIMTEATRLESDWKKRPTSLRDAKPLPRAVSGQVGFAPAWREGKTEVRLAGKAITPRTLGRAGNGAESLFFVPAHRSMLISDGWAAPFQKLASDTPAVARLFSQNLFDRFSGKDAGTLFPVEKHRSRPASV